MQNVRLPPNRAGKRTFFSRIGVFLFSGFSVRLGEYAVESLILLIIEGFA